MVAPMINELIYELKSRGVSFVKIVDLSMLSENEKRGYPVAILIGVALSPSIIDCSEFSTMEKTTDQHAEWTADFINAKGFKAYAQSERNLIDGFYDAETKTTPLPHKKIAMLAGLGWIGKSNLLITQEYGSAFCMCSVLTNAPLPTQNKPIMQSMCGECNVCTEICPAKVLHGFAWEAGINRDILVDVYHCETCLKCLTNCIWTQKYMNNSHLMN